MMEVPTQTTEGARGTETETEVEAEAEIAQAQRERGGVT